VAQVPVHELDVSVNICTYNRCGILGEALEGVLSQQIPDGRRYEVIVVDNNSTDETRQVVESFVARGYENLRYVFEGRQGLSYARNAAVSAARSPILAFTDDDVRVKPDWVATIKRMLDNHPEVDCVGGKVLPHWTFAPPSWLTSEHWAPLALVDYGDQPFYVNAGNQLCLLTANMAIRKDALERIGSFQPALQRVQNRVGSMEDHELLVRLWKTDRQGLYTPELVVTAGVASDRLSKTYHRRWHMGHGYFYALARLEEMERSQSGWLFDVPAHMYRRAACDALGWLGSLARGSLTRAFAYEVGLWFFAGFFSRRYQDFMEGGDRSHIRELGRFARSFTGRRQRDPSAPPTRFSAAQFPPPKR
jgi:glycosyltransferase involved in cell wall biosynthesis